MATYKNIHSKQIELQTGSSSSSKITFTVPSGGVTAYTLTFPATAGNNGQYLTTNGSGTTSWSDATVTLANDSTFRIINNSDNSKRIAFDASGVSASTTKTVKMANRNIDLTSMNNTGFDSWSGSGDYYSISLPTFTLLRGGTGYINGTLITFSGSQNITLYTNATTYVAIDTSGTLVRFENGTITIDTYRNYMMLFEVLYDGTITDVKNEQHPWTFNVDASSFFHNNLGTIIRGVGAVISTGTTAKTLQISSDTYEDHGLSMNIPSANPITWEQWYQAVGGGLSGKWIRYSTGTAFNNLYYCSGTTPTEATANNDRVVYRIYVTNGFAADGTQVPIYFATMHNAKFTSLTAANTAINGGTIVSATNELYAMEPCMLAYVVLRWQTGAIITIEQITIQKNTFNSRYVGGAASSSHLLLGDLSGGTYTDGGHANLVQLTSSTSAPTTSSDDTAYKLGTVWVKTNSDELYVCQNNTTGSAVWFCLNKPKISAMRFVPRTITAVGPTTLDSSYCVVFCDCSSNAVGINLPACAASDANGGTFYRIVKTGSSESNAVTITPNGSDKIDISLTSYTLSNIGDSVELLDCASTGWLT